MRTQIQTNPIQSALIAVPFRYIHDARDGDERSSTDPQMDDAETRVEPPVRIRKRRRTDELAKWTGALRVRGED